MANASEPAPPRPAEPDSEMAFKMERPEDSTAAYERVVTEEGAVPHTSSEDDVLVFGQRVHVHGELAKMEVHPPQHAPQTLNYAAVAREELHDVAQHPPHVSLLGGETGVEAWDKVNHPEKSHT
ncbi:hypothetical protein ACK3TF_002692 [Chlorella vulgaris]